MSSSRNGLATRPDGSSRVQKQESAADKVAALKARVAAAIGSSKAKGGLGVPLHPDLQNIGSSKSSAKAFDPPSSTHRLQSTTALENESNSKDQPKNPYFDESLAVQTTGSKNRQSRQLVFNQKGKYILQANALRRQAALEAMKLRIAKQTRRAGIDEDLDVEKNFLVQAPPDIEWWDEGLVDGETYEDIDDPSKLKIATSDTIITEYIQHPVALEPPQDRQTSIPKAMYLTPKEQAKLRRQRRMAELKEMQAKIRLGLVPAPPPKVKKGNLMRVLGDVAVKDPTAVEARVNREIAERHQQHVETNEDRRLTKEQKHEKIMENQQKDAEKGLYVLVFKIDSLANGQHRYKIAVNAEQHALTGICIMHPKMNLVIVEGGARSIKYYKKLMMQRINWTENAGSREKEGGGKVAKDWLLAENDKGELKDMSLNECKLVFEGEQKARGFRKWGSKVCETDAEARDALSRAKMDNFWSLAKGLS